MDVNITLLEELCSRKDAKGLSLLAGQCFEEALATSNHVLASELLLLKACALKGLGERDESLKTAAHFRDTMPGLIPDFLYCWGSLVAGKLMMLADEMNMAHTVLEEIHSEPMVLSDPVIRHDYRLLELEIKCGSLPASGPLNGEPGTLLSSYIDELLPLELYLFGQAGLRIDASGEVSPVDRFLQLCVESGEMKLFLETVEKAKLIELHKLPLWSRLPRRGAGIKFQKAMINTERRLEGAALEYKEMIHSVFKYGRYRAENPQLANSSPALRDILDPSIFNQKGKAVSSIFGEYMNDIRALCLCSPSMNVARAAIPVDIGRIQSRLGDGAAALSFYISAQAIYAGLVTKESVKCEVLDLIPSEIEEHIYEIMTAWSESASSDSKARTWKIRTIRDLYQAVTSPFERELKGLKALFICPDGVLNSFPFHIAESGGIAGSSRKVRAVSLYPSLTALSIQLKNLDRDGFSIEKNGAAVSHEKDCLQITDVKALSTPTLLQKNAFSISSAPLSLSELYSRAEPIHSSEILLSHEQFMNPMLHARSIKAALYLMFSLGIPSLSVDEKLNEGDGRETDTTHFLTFGDAGDEHDDSCNNRAVLPHVKGLMMPPLFYKGILYVGGEENRFFALNALTGEFLWDLKTGDWIRNPPSYVDDSIYLACMDRKIRMMNYLNGEIVWEYSAPGWILGTPLILGDNVVFASRDNYLFSIDRILGTVKQSKKVDAKITSTVWASDNVMILQTSDRVVRAYSPHSLEKTWERRICTASVGAGVLISQFLVCEDGKGTLMSIRTDTGNVEWQREIGVNVMDIQSCGANRLCLLTGGAEVKCIDLKSGADLWSYSGVIHSLTRLLVEKDTIMVQKSDKTLILLNSTTGDPIKVKSEEIRPAKILATHEGLLYLIDTEGRLFRHNLIEKRNDEYAAFLHNKKDLSSVEIDSPLWKGSLCLKSSPEKSHKELQSESDASLRDDTVNQENESCEADGRSDEDGEIAEAERIVLHRKEAVPPASSTKPLHPQSKPAAQYRGEAVFYVQPVLSGRTIVCATDDARVLGIDAESLQVIWEIQCSYVIGYEPHDCGNSFVAIDEEGLVYVVRSQDGTILKKFNLCFNFNSPPCIFEDRIYVGGDNNVLYCISITDEMIIWKNVLGAPVNIRPLIVDKTVYVIIDEGIMLLFDCETGEPLGEVKTLDTLIYDLWSDGNSNDLPDSRLFEPRVHGAEIILASSSPFVFSINQKNHKLKWKYNFGSRHLAAPPVCVDSGIILCFREGTVVLISDDNQIRRWKTELKSRVTTTPLMHDHLLLAGTEDGSLMALDKTSGIAKRIASFKEHMLFSPLNYGDSIIVAEGRKALHRFTCRTDMCYSTREEHRDAQEPPRKESETPLSKMIRQSLEKKNSGSGDYDESYDSTREEGFQSSEAVKHNEFRRKRSQVARTSTGSLFERLLIYGLLLSGISLSVYAHSNHNTDLLVLGIILTFVISLVVLVNISESQAVKDFLTRFSNEGVSAFIPTEVIAAENGMTVLFIDHQDYLNFSTAFTMEERSTLERDLEAIVKEVVARSGGKVLYSRDTRIDTGKWILFNTANAMKNHATRAVECSFEIQRRLRKYLEEGKYINDLRDGSVRMGFGIFTGIDAGREYHDGADEKLSLNSEVFKIALRLQKLTSKTGHQVVAGAPTINLLNGVIKRTFLGSFDVGENREYIDTYALSPAGR